MLFFEKMKNQISGLASRIGNLEHMTFHHERRLTDLLERSFSVPSSTPASKQSPSKLIVSTDLGNPTYYINEEGYAVVITGALAVPANNDTVFLFRGFYSGGVKDNADAGYYTEDGHPVSFFGFNGYEKHSSLYIPESVSDSSSND
jgi:hypothetical protein